MTNKADKGLRGGSCNRTACQAPNAWHWHTGLHKCYCSVCARDINRLNRNDALTLYGIDEIIVHPGTMTAARRAEWNAHGIDIPTP